MASLSDILNTVQQGVIAVNNLVTQTSGSFLNIQAQLTALNSSGVKSFNTRIGAVTPAQGDYPTSLIPGTTTNDSATVGNIGEFVSVSVSSGAAIAGGSATNVNVASISLSAGDWDVSGNMWFQAAAALTAIVASVSTASAAIPSRTNGTAIIQATFSAATVQAVAVPQTHVSLAASATIFFVGQITSSGVMWGSMNARRAR